jgi:hypothetical protein
MFARPGSSGCSSIGRGGDFAGRAEEGAPRSGTRAAGAAWRIGAAGWPGGVLAGCVAGARGADNRASRAAL